MAVRLSLAQRAALAALAVKPIQRTRAGYGDPKGLVFHHPSTVESLARLGLVSIRQTAPRHYRASITGRGHERFAREIRAVEMPPAVELIAEAQAS